MMLLSRPHTAMYAIAMCRSPRAGRTPAGQLGGNASPWCATRSFTSFEARASERYLQAFSGGGGWAARLGWIDPQDAHPHNPPFPHRVAASPVPSPSRPRAWPAEEPKHNSRFPSEISKGTWRLKRAEKTLRRPLCPDTTTSMLCCTHTTSKTCESAS